MISTADIALIITLILTVMSIINFALIFKDRAGKPHKANETRITVLEEEVRVIKQNLKSDDKRIEQLDTETKILMRSINALLGHSLEGNNTEEMEEARREMNNYLIQK